MPSLKTKVGVEGNVFSCGLFKAIQSNNEFTMGHNDLTDNGFNKQRTTAWPNQNRACCAIWYTVIVCSAPNSENVRAPISISWSVFQGYPANMYTVNCCLCKNSWEVTCRHVCLFIYSNLLPDLKIFFVWWQGRGWNWGSSTPAVCKMAGREHVYIPGSKL